MSSYNQCLICNKNSPNGELCKDCFKMMINLKNDYYEEEFSEKEYTDLYFKLKKETNKQKNIKDIEEICINLYALSELLVDDYNNYYLIDRLNKDINEIKNIKFNNIKSPNNNLKLNNNYFDEIDLIPNIIPNQKNKENNFNDLDFRNKWPREHQCDDGHYVRSLSEMIIDNWLYNNGYVHAYEKSVYMKTNPNAVVLSDFYLPTINVYIEFWGLEDDEKYQKRKEEKIKLYDDNKYQRIDLNEKDLKRLNDIMPRLIGQYVKK